MIHKPQTPNQHLLENQQVVEEIRRHLWIESEKVGYDIGFETAARDWLEKFSLAWMKYYVPAQSVPVAPAKSKAPARRSAKSLKAASGSSNGRSTKSSARKS